MWTKDQQDAIDAPVSDILVTAAAGSGKTAVMVERLIQRIIAPDGVDIDKILVVTFTKAAASEIKERIAAKISEKLEEGDNPRLKNQLVLINRASISTIHSFCLDTIRNNFHLLNLAPDFKVGDSTELAILQAKAMGDVFDAHYEDEDKDFLRLVNSFTRKTDDALVDIVTGIYKFSRSTPDPDTFLAECEAVYAGDVGAILQYMLDSVRDDATYCAELYRKAIGLCRFDSAYENLTAMLSDELDFAEGIAKLCTEGWDRVYNYIKDYKFATIRSNKNMDTEVYQSVKDIRTEARDYLKSIIADKVNLPLAAIEEDTAYMKPCVSMLCTLVREFSDRYAQYKRDKNILDFDDFEHFALALLTDAEHPEVAENLRSRYEEMYVDEYQDCNGVQEAVFKAVSREINGNPNMFMVGDMKQCIYRFRNANPQLFKHKSDTYTPYGCGDDYNKIILSRNFRSRAEVLNCINAIFSQIMSENVGELNYTEDEYLYYGADYDDSNPDTAIVDIDIVDAAGDFEDADGEEKPAKTEAEANLVASRIRNLVESKYIVYDKSRKEYRPVRYRDIAILLRGVRGDAAYFTDALSECGIPTFCDLGGGYFDCEEVQFLINFIKIISNPLDDINLVSVMRSPVYNFTDREFLGIRTADRKDYFYNAILKYCGNADALSSKLKAFLKELSQWQHRAHIMRADEVLWHIAEDTGYMEYISTLPGAAMRKANVRMLINRARMFSDSTGGGVIQFAEYVDDMRLAGGDGEGAKLIGENDDVVRIMTIHKSKGLEFPVVFLSQTGKRFNTRDLSDPVLMHHDLGMGIDYVDEKKRFSYKLTVKNAVREKILAENLSEEMRLLYVALTRAREKLFITGVVSDYNKLCGAISLVSGEGGGKLHPRYVSSKRTYLDWILNAVPDAVTKGSCEVDGGGRCRVNVTSIYSLAGEDAGATATDVELPTAEEHSEYKGEILHRLTYEYPYTSLASLPRNVTVTEIKRIHETDDASYRLYRMPVLKKPSFIDGESTISAAERGTLMHLLMEKIKLTDGINHDTIREEIASLERDNLITSAQAESIDADAVYGFFSSELGRRMIRSDKVHREVPFEILVGADEIFRGVATDEKIVVQGMIDAYFIDESGAIILVDYKTDKRGDLAEEEFKQKIAQRYRLQMHYYDKALKLMLSGGVCRKYIYLFDLGEAIEIE